MSEIFVEKKETTIVQIINSVDIKIMDLKLDSYLKVMAICYDENKRPLSSIPFSIEGEEYKAWGLDDKYIYDLVLANLGLVEKIKEQ